MKGSGRWTRGIAGVGLWLQAALGFASASPGTLGAWEALLREGSERPVETLRAELEAIYAPAGRGADWFHFDAEHGWVRLSGRYRQVWGRIPPPASPTSPAEAGAPPPGEGLAGWKIALDPGHLGGVWGPMEQRSFSLGEGAVVQEGDLVLWTARRLQTLLEARGAEVLLVRAEAEPVTAVRPAALWEESFRDLLAGTGEVPSAEDVRRRAERLFFGREEIEARAERVAVFAPHFVVALHIDAAAWADPSNPSAVEANSAHVLVNGCYLPAEIADDRQRRQLVHRWLAGYAPLEAALGTALAETMAEATGLAPAVYQGANASRVNENPYLWARNLMANRIYASPVVYLEPWMLNHAEVYAWAAEGDFDGEREIGGVARSSLPATYADFVVAGIERFVERWEAARPASP